MIQIVPLGYFPKNNNSFYIKTFFNKMNKKTFMRLLKRKVPMSKKLSKKYKINNN
jgi:hypothetical protein